MEYDWKKLDIGFAQAKSALEAYRRELSDLLAKAPALRQRTVTHRGAIDRARAATRAIRARCKGAGRRLRWSLWKEWLAMLRLRLLVQLLGWRLKGLRARSRRKAGSRRA